MSSRSCFAMSAALRSIYGRTSLRNGQSAQGDLISNFISFSRQNDAAVGPMKATRGTARASLFVYSEQHTSYVARTFQWTYSATRTSLFAVRHLRLLAKLSANSIIPSPKERFIIATFAGKKRVKIRGNSNEKLRYRTLTTRAAEQG